MDWNEKERLTRKYWKGLSSPAEETLLKKYYSSDNEETVAYFQQLQEFSKLTLPVEKKAQLIEKLMDVEDSKRVSFKPVFLSKIAAAIVLCVGLTFSLFQVDNKVETSSQIQSISEAERERAFEITKQALLLVSAKLNKASEVTVALDKFGEAKNKIKGENSFPNQ